MHKMTGNDSRCASVRSVPALAMRVLRRQVVRDGSIADCAPWDEPLIQVPSVPSCGWRAAGGLVEGAQFCYSGIRSGYGLASEEDDWGCCAKSHFTRRSPGLFDFARFENRCPRLHRRWLLMNGRVAKMSSTK